MSNHLRTLRKDRGLAQTEVEKHTGIAQALLSKYENGLRLPPAESLIKLADFYGVSVDYILMRTDNPEVNR
ncbi:MAG: helix-turn-helix transcriptional regulator [Clostridiales bacterium]|nr:helix-turn-helix transcriptional regulator [Clostridiales bacterium]